MTLPTSTDPTIFPVTRNPIHNGDPANWPAWWVKFWRYVQQRIDQADDDFQDWVTPTLLNGWVAYGSGYATPGYMVQRGRVYLKGLMKSGTASSGSTGDVFALPTNLAPLRSHIFKAFAVNTTPTPDDPGIARVDARAVPDGQSVRVMGYGYGGTNGYVSLAGISWTLGA